jgi:hypothetical protein
VTHLNGCEGALQHGEKWALASDQGFDRVEGLGGNPAEPYRALRRSPRPRWTAPNARTTTAVREGSPPQLPSLWATTTTLRRTPLPTSAEDVLPLQMREASTVGTDSTAVEMYRMGSTGWYRYVYPVCPGRGQLLESSPGRRRITGAGGLIGCVTSGVAALTKYRSRYVARTCSVSAAGTSILGRVRV